MNHRWNTMATAIGGHRDDLLAKLHELGDFERSPYQDLVIGWTVDTDELLERLRVQLAEDPVLHSTLGRLVVSETTVPFDMQDAAGSLRPAVTQAAQRIGPHQYHVRVDARGWGHQLHAHDLELELAGFVWTEIERHGHRPWVGFTDPDFVVMVEIVGDLAGVSLIDREQRLRFPFMKVT